MKNFPFRVVAAATIIVLLVAVMFGLLSVVLW